MLEWILQRHAPHCDRIVLVVHPADREAIEAHVHRTSAVAIAEQASPTGMLDAILCGRDAVLATGADRIWITWCDQVLISRVTVGRLALTEAERPMLAAVFPIARQTDPYIHFDRDEHGLLRGVRQRREGDEMPSIGESDAGLFSLSRDAMVSELPAFAREAPTGRLTGERNFLPFLPWLAAHADVVTFPIPTHESMGVNTPADRAAAEKYLTVPD